ncbi:amine oxidase [copper-containing] 3 isoform X3 [Macaca mulatta]
MNQKTILVLLTLAVITIFALVCVLLVGRGGDGGEPSQLPHCASISPSAQPWTHPGQSQLFADLSREELTAVMHFLTQRLGPGLVDAAQARPSDNCVFSVELQLPPKAAALAHLDRGSPPPAREALAIVFFGRQPQPNVSELVVGPLPHPSYMRDVTVERHGGPLPYHRRPVLFREYLDIDQMIFDRELPQASGLLHHCCFYKRRGRNLVTMTTAPRGLQSGDRATWFGLYYNISGAGFFLHPVGLELLVNHKALDPARWTIQKVFYQGRYYDSLAQLEAQFEAGLVNVVLIPDNGTGGSWSLKSPVPPGPAPPLQFHPQGPRFSVQGRRVASSLWTFSFGLGAFSGPRIFDVRFQGERLVYEISLQEALAVYGGNSPAAMMTRYVDGGFGMGKYTTPLTRGVDCPYLATYVDWHFILESQAPKTIRDAFCVFEHNQGLPLRRHHSDLYSHYFGGLAETVLVVRSVSTLLNYDYVWDMVFHPSGAIETRFYATGYISSAFLFGATGKYGNQVAEHTLGTVHTHSAHFKVDLDVGAFCLSAHFCAWPVVLVCWRISLHSTKSLACAGPSFQARLKSCPEGPPFPACKCIPVARKLPRPCSSHRTGQSVVCLSAWKARGSTALAEGLEVSWGEGRKAGAHSVLGCSLAPSLKPGGGRVQTGQGGCMTGPPPSHPEQDWRTGSGPRIWSLSPWLCPGALSTSCRGCR